ncbi:MAG: FG-GAP repeat protein [Actinomycetota bacterium]
MRAQASGLGLNLEVDYLALVARRAIAEGPKDPKCAPACASLDGRFAASTHSNLGGDAGGFDAGDRRRRGPLRSLSPTRLRRQISVRASPYGVTAGDFDEDGKLDLVVGPSPGTSTSSRATVTGRRGSAGRGPPGGSTDRRAPAMRRRWRKWCTSRSGPTSRRTPVMAD